jgi:hypothetical protein
MAEISPLRRRMIEDMTVRNLSPATQQSYLNAVSKFSWHFGRSPNRLGLEDVHAFQVHLVATGISWPALNQIVCTLRFFYGVTAAAARLTPGRGTFHFEISVMPSLTKTCPKMVLPIKGVAFCVKDAFAKKPASLVRPGHAQASAILDDVSPRTSSHSGLCDAAARSAPR